jgi:hypothetical protein
MRSAVCFAVAMLAFGTSCASGRLPNARGLDVIVKPKAGGPATDASGARALQSASGCEADFVRVLASGAMLVRLWPTQAAPDTARCLQQIKSLPAIEYAEADGVMKTQ